MKRLYFDTPRSFTEYFNERTKEITDHIFNCVREGIEEKKKNILLFEVEVEGNEYMFDISLPKKEWVKALEGCLAHYEELNAEDECIDTYLLIQKLKS